MKEKSYMFCMLKKAIDRVPRNALAWVMRENGIPEVLIRSLSLYAETRLRVDSNLSERLELKIWMHQGSVLSHFHFPVVINIVTEITTEDVLGKLLYADDQSEF